MKRPGQCGVTYGPQETILESDNKKWINLDAYPNMPIGKKIAILD
jgi:hypothetical protein